MYSILRKILFFFDPEKVHYWSMNTLRLICSVGLFRKIVSNIFVADPKPVQLFGLEFRNPVGLGAGFDKNAKNLRELECLGFGFVEIGTVTPLPQAGNEKPRLFRLPKDKALINRMGFNNDGVKKVALRLRDWKSKKSKLVIGGNIGKNKITPNEEAWRDYEICFRELYDCVDYFVVNVSSPNTPGLRELQDKDALRKILSHLQTINKQHTNPKPILLKIAPDLSDTQINDVVELALEIKLDGLVSSNTTIDRSNLATSETELENIGAGGLSGKPIFEKSNAVLRNIYSKTNGTIPVIASGGIFTATDAISKKEIGAPLIQVWTGFIYEGPSIVKNILKKF